MAPVEIPTQVPSEAVAGLTWRFDISLGDYSPADGWALKIHWRGLDKLDLTGVADSTNSFWEFTGSVSATDIRSGVYQWAGVVEKSGEKFIVGTGTTFVLPNILTAKAAELQPYAEKALKIVEAQLLTRYEMDQSMMTLRARQLIREDIQKLEATRARLRAEVDAQRSKDFSMGRRVEHVPRPYL